MMMMITMSKILQSQTPSPERCAGEEPDSRYRSSVMVVDSGSVMLLLWARQVRLALAKSRVSDGIQTSARTRRSFSPIPRPMPRSMPRVIRGSSTSWLARGVVPEPMVTLVLLRRWIPRHQVTCGVGRPEGGAGKGVTAGTFLEYYIYLHLLF